MSFRYSVVMDTLAVVGVSVVDNPHEAVRMVKDAGFDAIDIPGNPGKVDADKIRDMAEAAGLEIPAIVGAWAYWHAGEERSLASPNADTRKNGIDYSRKCIETALSVGARIFEICAIPTEPSYPFCGEPVDQIRRNFVDSTKQICDYAGERGVDVLIEPINRFEGYAGFINDFDEALDVIEEVGAGNLGILADFFHMNIECVSIPESIRKAGARLGHIHLADSNRMCPGCGHVDFSAVVRTLKDIGYKGYLSMDCLPPKPDVPTFLTRSISYMKEIERTIELQEVIYGRCGHTKGYTIAGARGCKSEI